MAHKKNFAILGGIMNKLISLKKLVIYSVSISESGAETLMSLEKLKPRWYRCNGRIAVTLHTNYGIIVIETLEGFLFDGRSGPWILDWYEPNLGTLDKRIAWWVHDVLGHGTSFDFKTTNEILRQLLVIARDRKTKASLVRYSVSLSSSWFGVPKKGDKSFPNMDKIAVTYKGIVL